MASLAVLPYLPTLGHDFVMDDAVYIYKNPAVTVGVPLGAYFRDRATTASRVEFQRQSYRPLRTLAFRAVAASAGLRPAAFGVVDLLLYAASVLLVAALALAFAGGDRAAALVAVAWWAAAPVHVEPVSYYSALGDQLSLVLELGALVAAARAIRRREHAVAVAAASLVLAAAAMLAKEMAITVGGLVAVGVAVAWRRLPDDARRRALALLVGHAVVAVAFFVVHQRILGAVAQAPLTARGLAGGLLRAPLYAWTYLAIILSPVGHAAAYADVTHATWATALAWLAAIAVAVALWRGKQATLGAAAACLVVALLPVLRLVPLLATYADRFALVPSIAVALALAAAISAARGRARGVVVAVVALFAAVDLVASAAYARAWRDDRTLWQAAVAAEPRAALAQSNLGLALLREHRPDEALPHLAAAEAIDGASGAVLVGSAAAHDALGHAALAESYARRAVTADPNDARAHAILGSLYARRGDLAGAAAEADRARTLNPDLASAWTLAAHLADVRGRPVDALADWRRAAALVPTSADYAAEVARLSLVTGDRAGAATAASACLRLRPADARCRDLAARAGAAGGSP